MDACLKKGLIPKWPREHALRSASNYFANSCGSPGPVGHGFYVYLTGRFHDWRPVTISKVRNPCGSRPRGCGDRMGQRASECDGRAASLHWGWAARRRFPCGCAPPAADPNYDNSLTKLNVRQAATDDADRPGPLGRHGGLLLKARSGFSVDPRFPVS